jgi:hypothetical protein
MEKLLKAAFVAAFVTGSIGMVAVPAAHAAPTLCGGGTTIANTRVNGDLEVTAPTTPGQACTLSNVVIANRLLVDPGGNLVMLGTTVGTSLNATKPASIRIDSLGCAGTSCTTPSIVRGTAVIDGTTSVPAGFAKNYICNGTKFNGDSVSLKNSASTAPYDVGSATCSFGGNSAFGVVRITGYAGNVAFANNRAGDNINVSANTGGGSLVNNHSGGSILCGGAGANVPAYTASGNSAAFTDQSRFGTC